MKATRLLALVTALAAAAPLRAQVLEVARLNTRQIAALDRARTVVLLPGGILEEHGPYLPSQADGYLAERLTRVLADSIAARPGWTALVFPMIPLGSGPANEVGLHYSFPGSYPVRSATLRSVFMDLADELGAQGFRTVLVMHPHGAPSHNRALDAAGDYFHDTYGGRMVHLLGLVPVIFTDTQPSAAELAEAGFEIHAGMGETSAMLYLQPALVDSGYRATRPMAATTWAALSRVGGTPGWPGYFGSPRLASAARGEVNYRRLEASVVRHGLAIVDGTEDPRPMPRLGRISSGDAGSAAIDRQALARENAARRRQEAWLRAHPR